MTSATTIRTLPVDHMVTVDGTEYRVHGVQIITTDDVYFRAWERNAPGSGHTTITSFGESALAGHWGTVASRGLPASIAALPAGSDERIAACRTWKRITDAFAVQIVIAACPWLAEVGRVDGDEVWCTTAELVAHEPDAEAF